MSAAKRDRDEAVREIEFSHVHGVVDWQRKFLTPAFNPNELSLTAVNPDDKLPVYFLSGPVLGYEYNFIPPEMFQYLRDQIPRTDLMDYVVDPDGKSIPIRCPPGTEIRRINVQKEDVHLSMATWRLFKTTDAIIVIAGWYSDDAKTTSMSPTIVLAKCAHAFIMPDISGGTDRAII